MKSAAYEQVARLGRACAHPHRLELLELIAQAEQPVDTLARISGMPLTTASSHLQVLKNAGLVRTRRQGTTIFYRLAGDEVAGLVVALTSVASKAIPELRLLDEAGRGRGAAPRVHSVNKDEEACVLDVRPDREFQAGHYPGAVSIPLDQLPSRLSELPLDRRVVVYCRGEFCDLAMDAARLLRDRGIDAYAMAEGVLEWRASGAVVLDATA
ncbi:MAG: metalloregulator ArsR/SmtB family transcription factor [Actinomycetota bacterium]